MKIQKFNPVVWLVMFALSFSAYLVRISLLLDFPFKVAYNFVAFALMFGFIVFESWRLEGIDWKEISKKRRGDRKWR